MISAKRTIIEISSDEDDDNPLVARRKFRKLRAKAQQNPQRTAADTDSAQNCAAFVDFLARTLPIRLIPEDIAAYIHREANIRLETAKHAGVALEEMSIGDDCLPTWPGLQWDPEVESLHCVIQNRLLDRQISQELGVILRDEVITKGNRRLDEARRLGIDLQDIVIGKCLLAVWTTSTGDDEEELDREGDLADDEMEPAIPHALAEEGQEQEEDCDSPRSEAFSYSSSTTFMPSPPRMSFHSTSTDSDSSSSDSDVDEDDFGDVITLDNFVHHHPTYSDPDADDDDDEGYYAPHVLHDVEIVGGPVGFSNVVDLEVYLVEDDEDVDELPELELAIDREGFEYYFGDEDAVDIEIPNVEVRCSGDFSTEAAEEGDDDYEDDSQDKDSDAEAVEEEETDYEFIQALDRAQYSELDKGDHHHQQRIREGKHVSFDDDINIVINPSITAPPTADASEQRPDGEATDEAAAEVSGVSIEETEYGFKW